MRLIIIIVIQGLPPRWQGRGLTRGLGCSCTTRRRNFIFLVAAGDLIEEGEERVSGAALWNQTNNARGLSIQCHMDLGEGSVGLPHSIVEPLDSLDKVAVCSKSINTLCGRVRVRVECGNIGIVNSRPHALHISSPHT